MIKLTSILSEDLRKWFGKGPTGGWDRYNSKGEKAGKCGDSEEGSKYAACLSNEKAAKLGKDGRASFVKRKQTAQSKAGDAKKGGEQKKGQKPVFVKTGASENVNEAGMNPVKKVVNAILKKHNVQAMKTYASSVRGAHNIINGGYRWEGDWHLGFYGNVPQDVVEKVAAEMEKAGVKYVKVTKGHISADFTKTGLNEVKLNDLVNTRFSIEVGSGKTTGNWSNEELIEKLKEAIKHNLFDREFYYNWTDLGKEYNSIFEKETLSPMIKNIDRTLKEFFVLKGSTLVFRLEGSNAQKWIDKWFQTKKSISTELKSDYYSYRKKYAGVTLRESVNEDWSQKYKNSIDCNNPKGFSQKAHCAGKNENKSNNIDEAIHPEVYREFMQACNDAGLNSFQIFGLHVLVYILTLGATGVTILSALGIAQLAKDAKDTFNNWNAGRKLNPEKVKAIVKDFENKVNKLEGGRKKFFQGIINKMKKTNPENKSALVSINKDLEYYAKAYGIKEESMNLEEKLNLFLEKNVPTDPQKWAASIAAAKKKFDVYPSAYANGWAAKNYKEKGGGWKTAK